MPDYFRWGCALALSFGCSALAVFGTRRLARRPLLGQRADAPLWMDSCVRSSSAGDDGAGSSDAHAALRLLAALTLGVVAGYAWLGLWPRWPPAKALDRWLTLVMPSALILAVMIRQPMKGFVRAIALGAVAVAYSRVLLHRSVVLEQPGAWVAVVGWGAALGVVLMALPRLYDRQPDAPLPFSLVAALFTAGCTVLFAGYVRGGLAALPWACALAGVACGESLSGNPLRDARSLVQVATVALFSVVFIGRYFGRLGTLAAAGMLGAPLLCWATELPPLRSWPTVHKKRVQRVLVAAALGVMLWTAKRGFDRNMAPLLGPP